MRFECEACGHLGEAARILPSAQGVGLECAQCGHATTLAPSSPPETVAEAPAPTQAQPARAPDTIAEPERAPAAQAGPGTLVEAPPRTVEAPEPIDPVEVLRKRGVRIDPGSGPVRCPKCGFRQQAVASCARCGLELRSQPQGQAHPWDQVPAGKEAQVQELEEGWRALVEEDRLGDEEAREALIRRAVSQGLLDRLARRFRFYAQDHHGTPRGDAAALGLASIVEKMHATFLATQGGSRQDMGASVRRMQVGLYVIVGVMCLAILGLALLIFAPR
jgi:hypothetical protein